MLLEDELVEMNWSCVNKRRYTERGYKWTKVGDKFHVKAKDAIECSSSAKIPVKCDYCGKIYYPTSRNYKKAHAKKDLDCCVSCKGKEIRETVKKKYGVENVMQVKEIADKNHKTCLEKYGVTSPLKSREIYEKTKASLSANGNCKTSKKQIELNEMLKNIYGDSKLNYPCGSLLLDCFIEVNNIKIDVEYDGMYWHKDTQDADRRRNYFVESQGFKVLRIHAYKNLLPTQIELTNAIDYLMNPDKKYTTIDIGKC